MGHLTCTVRTEVEEDAGIAILNHMSRLALLLNHARNHKLIIYLLIIGALHRLGYGREAVTNALRHRVICLLDTIVVLITIHRIVTTGDHRDLTDTELGHLRLDLLEEGLTGIWWRITAIEEGIEIYLR